MVVEQPCPLLVPLIETLPASEQPLIEALLHYLEPLKAQQVDTLILGCTHYAFTQKYLQKLVPSLSLVCARDSLTLSYSNNAQKISFFVSGDTTLFNNNINLFVSLSDYTIQSF